MNHNLDKIAFGAALLAGLAGVGCGGSSTSSKSTGGGSTGSAKPTTGGAAAPK